MLYTPHSATASHYALLQEALMPQGIYLNSLGAGDAGEINRVLYATDARGARLIVKTPHNESSAAGSVRTEAAVVERASAQLQAAVSLGGLSVPRFVSYDPLPAKGVPYLVLSYVDGDVLTTKEVQQFTEAEQDSLGQRLGSFIAVMAGILQPPEYKRLTRDMDTGQVNQLARLHERAEQADMIAATGFPSVAALVRRVDNQSREYEQRGLLEPCLVGHDDLHERNMTFTGSKGGRTLQGVFDFGGTKLSSPERELRHMKLIGCEGVVAAARHTYEAITGATLRGDLITFWAMVRLAVSSSGQIKSGTFGRREPYLLDLLGAYFPEWDWSELEKVRQYQ